MQHLSRLQGQLAVPQEQAQEGRLVQGLQAVCQAGDPGPQRASEEEGPQGLDAKAHHCEKGAARPQEASRCTPARAHP